ncbi:alpha-D-ribose 1-methylphosphonate 5-triphosphate synthase subunit PhnH [Saccharopolyspora kobensis]|uniref:Alpha-D-ribose 1-methylphosphonate 5-triphosphate synthase subunit PhnH n=1 Tax=Saccharopolyspora kobensis TaxID=146035 RepID=A0A1H6CUU5_9PSEU|nr:phosphonate C-P lyase system protein PhnH [Saccharopolyspora kobensis]SEG76577.1 alpha-D-ribose 1-methylphosphonate 5-triphosphate synthase subunit PhnH [Saccharopolyspora kobensis]SFC99725.1 alpha-D-ribose 1-methylphosphonate 5-triphosphate synthase subunit PhnH [Saccharopolyspora kobensis]
MTASLAPRQAQQVFRTVLDALSRPGEVLRLPAISIEIRRPISIEIASTRVPAALLPVLALADLETPVHVDGWADVVRTQTSAPIVERTGARLAALLEPVEDLAGFPVGSAGAPEEAALVALAVRGFGDGPALRLSGPGVPGHRELRVSGLPADFAERRRELIDFPAGFDLLLVAPDGEVVGLPRSTRVEEGA